MRVLFRVSSLVVGLAYWWQADWWAYVEFPEGPVPEFVLPWWWQVIQSGAAGALGGGLVVAARGACRRVHAFARAT
jgi:hypothetical protein